MRVILGADHGGFLDKEKIKEYLVSKGMEVVDVGAPKEDMDDDFVDYAVKAVAEFAPEDKAILFCRNGFGMMIVANRYKGIRCGLGFNKEAVIKGRNDDDINCLSIPSDYLSVNEVIEVVDVFLESGFSNNPRYQRRINKIDNI